MPLLLSAVLLFAPWILSATWALSDPSAAASLVPGDYSRVTEPRPAGQDLGLSAGEEAAFSSEIFTNNIRVTMLAFAAGILAGIGTAAVLILNGVLLGIVSGLAIGAGNGRPFFELVAAHGVLELSCIVVAGAAGLRFGWALVEPGRRTRADSLRREARPALALDRRHSALARRRRPRRGLRHARRNRAGDGDGRRLRARGDLLGAGALARES